jgi:hypothetical protein
VAVAVEEEDGSLRYGLKIGVLVVVVRGGCRGGGGCSGWYGLKIGVWVVVVRGGCSGEVGCSG